MDGIASTPGTTGAYAPKGPSPATEVLAQQNTATEQARQDDKNARPTSTGRVSEFLGQNLNISV